MNIQNEIYDFDAIPQMLKLVEKVLAKINRGLRGKHIFVSINRTESTFPLPDESMKIGIAINYYWPDCCDWVSDLVYFETAGLANENAENVIMERTLKAMKPKIVELQEALENTALKGLKQNTTDKELLKTLVCSQSLNDWVETTYSVFEGL